MIELLISTDLLVLNIQIVIDILHSLSPHLNKKLTTLRGFLSPHLQLELLVAGLHRELCAGLVVQHQEHPVRPELRGGQLGTHDVHLVRGVETVESQLQRALTVLPGRV